MWSQERSSYLKVEGALRDQSYCVILYHEDLETYFGDKEVIGVLNMIVTLFGREVEG